jgi:hypothetical protein
MEDGKYTIDAGKDTYMNWILEENSAAMVRIYMWEAPHVFEEAQ